MKALETRELVVGDKLYFQSKNWKTGEIVLSVFSVDKITPNGHAISSMNGIASRRFVAECFKSKGQWCAKSVHRDGKDDVIAVLENERLLSLVERLIDIEIIFGSKRSQFARMSDKEISDIAMTINKYKDE